MLDPTHPSNQPESEDLSSGFGPDWLIYKEVTENFFKTHRELEKRYASVVICGGSEPRGFKRPGVPHSDKELHSHFFIIKSTGAEGVDPAELEEHEEFASMLAGKFTGDKRGENRTAPNDGKGWVHERSIFFSNPGMFAEFKLEPWTSSMMEQSVDRWPLYARFYALQWYKFEDSPKANRLESIHDSMDGILTTLSTASASEATDPQLTTASAVASSGTV